MEVAMKVFIIAIVMWWGDISQQPPTDAVEVKTLHGKPLIFRTTEECYDHVNENLDALKAFGRAYYPTSNAVKTILCVEYNVDEL
tara:strand:+ start:559 stop:813 length:255 start_codon:yes stop_codon:yes gene_type:complete